MTVSVFDKNYLEYLVPIVALGYIVYLLNHKKLLESLIFASFVALAGVKGTSINVSIIFALSVCLILFHYHDFLPQRIEEGMRLNSRRERRVYYDTIDSPWFDREQKFGPDAPNPEFGDFDEEETGDEATEDFNYLEPFASGCPSTKKNKVPKMMSKEKRQKLRERMKTVKDYRQRKKHLKEEEKKMYSKLPPKYYQNVNEIFKTKTRSLNESFKKYDKLKENFYMIINS